MVVMTGLTSIDATQIFNTCDFPVAPKEIALKEIALKEIVMTTFVVKWRAPNTETTRQVPNPGVSVLKRCCNSCSNRSASSAFEKKYP